MAKKAAADVNKAEAIRSALADNPGKPPRVIAELLVAKGVPVTAQYVSIVKSTSHGKKKRKTVKVAKPRKGSSLSPIGAAIDFIRAAGGLAAAKAALAAIEEIKKL